MNRSAMQRFRIVPTMLRPFEAVAGMEASHVVPLVERLAAANAVPRMAARNALVALGKRAVPELIRSLSDHRPRVRWEAVKILGLIADPAAADAFVQALEDDNDDVRWLAAMGLVALRRTALRPLLRALEVRSSSWLLRDGAHHVCQGLASKGFRDVVRPILTALDAPMPEIATPVAAYRALSKLR